MVASFIIVMVLYLNFPDRRMATSLILIGVLGRSVVLLLIEVRRLIYATNLRNEGARLVVTLRAHALIKLITVLTGTRVKVGPVWRRGPRSILVNMALTLRLNVLTLV